MKHPIPTTRAPSRLVEHALFTLGMHFVGPYAAASWRVSDTRECREMLAVTKREDRRWVLAYLRAGVELARQQQNRQAESWRYEGRAA